MGTWTPWGTADGSTKYARGVIFYTTPGHGGFHLSTTTNVKVHEAWRRRGGWYEEDIDWAIVILTFPHLFNMEQVENAKHIAKSWLPHQYMKVTGEVVEEKDSHKLREERAQRELADKWVAISAFGDWHPKVPKGMVVVCATKGAQRPTIQSKPEERWFLVNAHAYNDKNLQTPIGYVIDEDVEQRVDPIQ